MYKGLRIEEYQSDCAALYAESSFLPSFLLRQVEQNQTIETEDLKANGKAAVELAYIRVEFDERKVAYANVVEHGGGTS